MKTVLGASGGPAVPTPRSLAASDRMHRSLSAHDLENLIELWRAVLIHETDREKKRYAEARMRELIAQRAPEQIAEMELERGLRAP